MRDRVVITIPLALLFLHAALSAFYWLPDTGFASAVAPTWDLLGLVLLVAGYAWLRDRYGPAAGTDKAPGRAGPRGGGARSRPYRLWTWLDRALSAALVLVVAVFFVLGFAQGFAHREFGYDVILVLHLPFVPELFSMMYSAEPLGMFVLYCALLIVGIALVVVVTYLAVTTLLRGARAVRVRRAMVGGVALFTMVGGIALSVQPTLGAEAAKQISYAVNLDDRLQARALEIEAESERLRARSPFADMQDPPSIYVFTIESYGAVVFRDEEMWGWAEEFMAESEKKASEAGYHSRTGYLDCPVFGGSSWMAQATMLCGTTISDQESYDGLLRADATCAPRALNEAGYRTSVVGGNITYLDEGYERNFPFDGHYYFDELSYEGRRYSWSKVPDQYVINFLHEREVLQHPDTPRYIHYKLTNSHHPWDEVPPYADDWSRIDDGSEVFSRRGENFDNRFLEGENYRPGYWATVKYSMRSVFDYLEKIPEDDALIVILGDHQPRSPVADMDDNTWWTPVHVLSRDPRVIEHYGELGYVEGIVPPDLDPDDPKAQPDALADLFLHIFHPYDHDATD